MSREEPPAVKAVVDLVDAECQAMVARQRDRHRWMVEHADHSILKALLEAHGPDDSATPTDACWTCEPTTWDTYGNPTPRQWPCPVWAFINDRMPNPLKLT